MVCYITLEPLNELIESDISLLFPGQNEVFAHWFTGVIKVPDGKLINYVHAGFASTYEEDLLITFKKGVLDDFSTIENDPDMINIKELIGFFAKIERAITKLNSFKNRIRY